MVMGAVVAPMIASAGPSARALGEDTTFDLATASVTFPAGWSVDIADASTSRPSASLGDVTVATADAVWFGTSARLLEHAADLAFASSAVLPEVPAEAKGTEREEWTLTPAADAPESDPARVVVVRQEEGVVLVIVRGPADAVAAQQEAIDAIVASVSLNAVQLDVDVAA